ncbi:MULTISPECIES: glycosyltransferase family 2 protein [unclassified Shimia]|uniref:glycosyltransferase family 2 protein n=1 Tax=unclassified Shimia TaxID=2630038 RepID=UPI003104CAF5
MTADSPTWGVVATIKAPSEDILNFVAYHLEQGAKHIWIYLDAPAPEAKVLLKAHPQVTPISTGENFWIKARGKRPFKHQIRQSHNVEHAYARARDVDWLLHIDVDEFLMSPDSAVTDHLANLPDSCVVARVRPAEALANEDGTTETLFYKSHIADKATRRQVVSEVYPTFGAHLRGGFLSHVAGKIFIRTGQSDLQIKIHNAFRGEHENPGQVELRGMSLLHQHTLGWEHWRKSFGYRHRKGSYRAELGSALPEAKGGMTLHALFDQLSQEPDGLRQFYEEVCVASEDLRRKLATYGLLQQHALHLAEIRRKHFSDF